MDKDALAAEAVGSTNASLEELMVSVIPSRLFATPPSPTERPRPCGKQCVFHPLLFWLRMFVMSYGVCLNENDVPLVFSRRRNCNHRLESEEKRRESNRVPTSTVPPNSRAWARGRGGVRQQPPAKGCWGGNLLCSLKVVGGRIRRRKAAAAAAAGSQRRRN